MHTNFTCVSPSKVWDRPARRTAVTGARSHETGPSESEVHRLRERPVHAFVESHRQDFPPAATPACGATSRGRRAGASERKGTVSSLSLNPAPNCKPGKVERPRPQRRMPVGKIKLRSRRRLSSIGGSCTTKMSQSGRARRWPGATVTLDRSSTTSRTRAHGRGRVRDGAPTGGQDVRLRSPCARAALYRRRMAMHGRVSIAVITSRTGLL